MELSHTTRKEGLMSPAYITVEEIAERLCVSVKTVYRRLDAGVWPEVNFAHRRLVPRSDFDAWEQAQLSDARAMHKGHHLEIVSHARKHSSAEG